MKARIYYSLLAALIAALLWFGCESEPTHCNFGPYVTNIEIVFGTLNDTLNYMPNDSASTSVTITVTDEDAEPIPGLQVDISLSDSNFGALEFYNEALQDTTDAAGRIQAVFRIYNQPGLQTITASAGSITVSRTLLVRETDDGMSPIFLLATPTSLTVDSNEIAQVSIVLTIVDDDYRGIPNVLPEITFTGGWITAVTPTDSTGRTTFFWNFYNEFGFFTLQARHGNLCESAEVEVRYQEPFRFDFGATLGSDTFLFLPTDSAAFPPGVTLGAFLVDADNQVMVGVPVHVSVSNGALGHIEYPLDRYERTGSNGQAVATFISSLQEGEVTITACALGVEREVTLHCLEAPNPNLFSLTTSLISSNDTIYVPVGESDSIRIRIYAFDANGNPASAANDVCVGSQVTNGRLLPLRPIRHGGSHDNYWYFHDNYGTFYLRMHNVNQAITVLPPN